MPLLTFTAPHGIDHVEHAHPASTYLDTIALGLRESRGWGAGELSAYFDSVLPAPSVPAPRRSEENVRRVS